MIARVIFRRYYHSFPQSKVSNGYFFINKQRNEIGQLGMSDRPSPGQGNCLCLHFRDRHKSAVLLIPADRNHQKNNALCLVFVWPWPKLQSNVSSLGNIPRTYSTADSFSGLTQVFVGSAIRQQINDI